MKQDDQHKTEIWLCLWYKTQRTTTFVALFGPIYPLQKKYCCVSFLTQLKVPQTDLQNSSYARNKIVNPFLCLSVIFYVIRPNEKIQSSPISISTAPIHTDKHKHEQYESNITNSTFYHIKYHKFNILSHQHHKFNIYTLALS